MSVSCKLQEKEKMTKPSSINRVQRHPDNIATHNCHITAAPQNTPIIIKRHFNLFLLTCVIVWLHFTFCTPHFIHHILMWTRSRILKTLPIEYQNAFWVAAWRWLYKEVETFFSIVKPTSCTMYQIYFISEWHSTCWRIKDRLDVTCYFISLLMCSTCFGH